MKRYDDSGTVESFLSHIPEHILGELAQNNQFDLTDLQRNAWEVEIDVLKDVLIDFKNGTIIFEYTIPRIGKRVDNVLIYQGHLFLLEFKVGETSYPPQAIRQLIDYALDLKNFHMESHSRTLIPILISTDASESKLAKGWLKNQIHNVICCNNRSNLKNAIHNAILEVGPMESLYAEEWINAKYMPTPTIIETAQALYRGHNVTEISRNDASAINLESTTLEVNKIIDDSKRNHKKSICFITGVPGAGKTLAGLNVANTRHNFEEDEHAVFLSGNGPLVEVLQEALARDQSQRENITKSEALTKTKTFIQIIHHFRDDAISVETAPIEKITIFDEAQRAWNKNQLCGFMKRKKGVLNFQKSEPEFLIDIMDRHTDWAVIICLVGEGQEINTGEAGITEWFNVLKLNYSDWNIYVSNKITYFHDASITERINYSEKLHLSVSLRSFRNENVSEFVKKLLDADLEKAKECYTRLKDAYPIALTRDLTEAKKWIRNHAKGSERYGIIASSGGKRLKSQGIWVENKINVSAWFLNNEEDIRSSYYLEDTATEFDIQGLELDWTLVAWDANMRFENGAWKYYDFKGTKWQNINKPEVRCYLKNAYRVLLTRARQGMIIYIPYGDENDATRNSQWYDSIYELLKSVLAGSEKSFNSIKI